MDQSTPVEVFAARDTLEAYFVCNLLRDAGLQALVVGDLLRGIVGELPPIQTTPKIWVIPPDADRARAVIQDYERYRRARSVSDAPNATELDPFCFYCGEAIGPNDRVCPSCGKPMDRDDELVTDPLPTKADVTSEHPFLTVETSDRISILTLNRPEKRNPLSLAMLLELQQHLRNIETDRSVRVVIIRASGTVFSSGHDLREMVGASDSTQCDLFTICSDVMQRIRRIPQPVIAEVQGVATAGGCQLAASCDLVVASENATFATPGVRIGLFCTTPAVPLVRAIPLKKAMEMLLTGDSISARQAEQLGLVNRVVPAERLHDETMSLAKQICSASAETIEIGKRAVYQQMQLELSSAYRLARDVMIQNVQLPDAQEGIQAFLEKRKPKWRSQ